MKTTMLVMIMALGFSARLVATALDGEQVYKSNCNRCHITIRTYPAKMSRSIVRHMRIRALLTKPEADAVLAYLVNNFDPGAKSKTRRVGQ